MNRTIPAGEEGRAQRVCLQAVRACSRGIGGQDADLVVGHSDKGLCFGIKDGIKRAGLNGKILVWQWIIAGFDPSRPSQVALFWRTLLGLAGKAALIA
jgi:hypothetical protein